MIRVLFWLILRSLFCWLVLLQAWVVTGQRSDDDPNGFWHYLSVCWREWWE